MIKRIVDTEMPLAVFFMILLGTDEIKYSDIRVKRLARPLYYKSKVEEKNTQWKQYFSDEIYNNVGEDKISYHDNEECDEFYRDILDNKRDYNFSALLKFFSHFYGYNKLNSIAEVEDVKECYKTIVKHRTKTKGVDFDKEYCWRISQMFLPKGSYIESLDLEVEPYIRRKEMVKNACDVIYISGTTLKDALSVANENAESSIIHDIFNNGNIKTVNIFLLNYVYVGINQEDASKEIEISILNILQKVRDAERCPQINIVLLSDFDISFSLLTQEALLIRSTNLFTKQRCYKGQYLFFNSKSQEYKSMHDYFNFLLKRAYNIDINSRKESVYEIKKQMRANNKLGRFVTLKKIHPVQLENLVRSSFVECHKRNYDLSKFKIVDHTQEVLLPYLFETEKLLESVVKEHDCEGWAKIIPSADLGFPNNVLRISGGFLTGALYDWYCSVPIVPVDATVNTCTSSAFKLEGFDESMSNEDFKEKISLLCKNAMENGYSFNLESGNHFLMVAKDDDKTFYLILHCSATQSKESCFGLYPSEHAWFNDNIKTKYNEDKTRYIRYIRGDAAVRFIDYTNRFHDFNEELHYYIAKHFANFCGTRLSSENPIIKHHYGMPTSSSIAIGTFVVNINTNDLIVPVFSDFGRDVCLYELSHTQPQTYTLSGTSEEVVLVPHGWGQIIDGIEHITISNVEQENQRLLTLELKDSSVQYPVAPSARLSLNQKRVRSFDNINDFFDNECTYINGSVKKLLHPVFCYCEHSKKNNCFKINDSERVSK